MSPSGVGCGSVWIESACKARSNNRPHAHAYGWVVAAKPDSSAVWNNRLIWTGRRGRRHWRYGNRRRCRGRAAAVAVSYSHGVAAARGRVVRLVRRAADRAAVQLPLIAGCAARCQRNAAALAEGRRAAGADRRRRRVRVHGESDVTPELAVAAERVELRSVDAGLRDSQALTAGTEIDAVLPPMDARRAVGVDDLAAALADRERGRGRGLAAEADERRVRRRILNDVGRGARRGARAVGGSDTVVTASGDDECGRAVANRRIVGVPLIRLRAGRAVRVQRQRLLRTSLILRAGAVGV